MSEALTYTSLLKDVANYAERSDPVFIAQIPRFVELAEKQISAEFKSLWEVRVVENAIEGSKQYFEKPTRLRKVISLATSGEPVYERTHEYIQMIASEMPRGKPLYWSEVAYKYIAIAPTPDKTYPLTLVYYEQVEPLDQKNQTNLITDVAPQLLLFGCMLQAATFLKDQGMLQYWDASYKTASMALKAEDAQRIVDRNASAVTQQP